MINRPVAPGESTTERTNEETLEPRGGALEGTSSLDSFSLSLSPRGGGSRRTLKMQNCGDSAFIEHLTSFRDHRRPNRGMQVRRAMPAIDISRVRARRQLPTSSLRPTPVHPRREIRRKNEGEEKEKGKIGNEKRRIAWKKNEHRRIERSTVNKSKSFGTKKETRNSPERRRTREEKKAGNRRETLSRFSFSNPSPSRPPFHTRPFGDTQAQPRRPHTPGFARDP